MTTLIKTKWPKAVFLLLGFVTTLGNAADLHDFKENHGATQMATTKIVGAPEREKSSGYVVEFYFYSNDPVTDQPLETKLSRSQLRTAAIVESQSPMSAGNDRAYVKHALRLLISDLDNRDPFFSLEEETSYERGEMSPEVIAKRMQTIWLTVNGQELRFDWAVRKYPCPLMTTGITDDQTEFHGVGVELKECRMLIPDRKVRGGADYQSIIFEIERVRCR